MAIEDLRRNRMMAHLLDSIEAGIDIGHYGRLVFVMVARHFAEDDEIVRLLVNDPDVSEAEARSLCKQIVSHDYSPPTREKVLDWQSHQAFPICPDPDDPYACNVYHDLEFPPHVYEHISEFYGAPPSHHN